MRELCSFPSFSVMADSTNGLVKSYPSVAGVIDDRNSVVEFGAFRRTIAERGPSGANRIVVLRSHDPDKIIGHPLLMAEHAREQLPEGLLARFPQAVGGLYCETQLNLKIDEGRDAFHLLEAGDLREWSFGFEDLTNSGKREYDANGLRHMRELKVWEYSCVAWGANDATQTISVNSAPWLDEMLEELRRAGLSDEQMKKALRDLLSPSKSMPSVVDEPTAPAPDVRKVQIDSLLINALSVENDWHQLLR